MVIELDGKEVILKNSVVRNFSDAAVKSVISMAMTKAFDGQNCFSKSVGARVAKMETREFGFSEYVDFSDFPLYTSWRPDVGTHGIWFGTSDCVPSYIHYGADNMISIYRNNKDANKSELLKPLPGK